jgi:GH15 family glucan-1,4-alpha-glucosidase
MIDCSPAARIEDHGIIGNLQTVALVSTAGTIDFVCFPRFDSPTIFAALLDSKNGGQFTLAPLAPCRASKQIYLPETNVLLTRFFTDEGVVEIRDFMPIAQSQDQQHFCMVRSVRAVRGKVRMALRCAPRFNYARVEHSAAIDGDSVIFRPTDGSAALRLSVPRPSRVDGGDAITEFVVCRGEDISVCLEAAEATSVRLGVDAVDLGLNRTLEYWRRWSDRSNYKGRWREAVMRSALTLKLLMSKEFGSLVAAATFGLPEITAGSCNWDYRYCWIRDSALAMYAFMRLGYIEEATRFLEWIEARCTESGPDGSLQLMYGIDGRRELDELELDHLCGYQDSRPVLIGNAAGKQLQLDIYGPLLDAVYLANKWGAPTSVDSWAGLVRAVEYVCTHWSKADAGIWETRSGMQHHLHSRLMCWVAVDRAYRLAVKRSLPAPLERWAKVRNEVHADIVEHFWNEDLRAFVQTRKGRSLDASVLMMPLMRFVAPRDPRWLATLEAIKAELFEDPEVFRCRNRQPSGDGSEPSEGTFTTCSFWYVEALCRADRLDEARLLFEQLLTNANHLGLYSEERGSNNEQLGNFPQALTHLAMISTAFCLDRKLTHERPKAWS